MTKKKETPPPGGDARVCDGCFTAYPPTEPACPSCGKANRAEGGRGFLDDAEPDPVLKELLSERTRAELEKIRLESSPHRQAAMAAAEAKRTKDRHRDLTRELAMLELKGLLPEIIERPRLEWLPTARQAAAELGLRLRDTEIARHLYQARQAQRGRLGPVLANQPLELTPTPWVWEGVLLAGCPNLLVGGPKCCKTTMVASWIAAWSRGAREFLGRELVGACPPVALCWVDQPERDSARMLAAAGLLKPDGSLAPPITALWTSGRALHLDPEGVEELANWGEEHPGGVLIVDSYAAATRTLALEEASGEFASPFIELAEALEPFGITLVLVHHASKGRAGEGPAMASRGSTALPAAASQIVAIARVSPQNPADRRLLLQAEGRGGPAVHMLIERHGDGWICHGTGDEVIAAQRRDQARERLTERQQAAMDLVARRWRDGAGETTASDLVGEAAGCDLEGKSGPRLARKVLAALGRMELVHLRRVGNGLSARPWGEAERPPGPPYPPGPPCPAGPQISHPDGSEDLEDLEDSPDGEDLGDLCDRLQVEADQLLLEGMA